MKKFLKLALLSSLFVGVLSGVAACGKGEADDKAESNELSVAAWAYDANPEFKAMVEAFEKENEGVKIKIVDIAADQYEDKVTTMLSAGDSTDVLGIKGVGSYVNYATKGQLLDLSEEAEAIENPENFKGNLDGYKLEGKYYALPFRKDIYMLFYNKKLFDDNKTPYPENLTWEEYEELAEKLTTEKDGEKIYGTYHHIWYPILLCTAANQTDSSLLDGEYGFAKEYLDRWIRMQDAGVTMDYSSIKTASVTYASQFETEKTAMMPMGSFYLGKLLNAAKENRTTVEWGITSMPQNEKGAVSTYGGPSGFAVNKGAKNPELAKKFVSFCAGEKGAKAVAAIGMTPAYQSEDVMNVLYTLDGMPQDEESKKALNPDKNGWEMLPDPKAAEINAVINEEYDLIMVEDSPVKKGIDALNSRAKEVLEEDN
ncbi:sugar ABC transporter substrate-binding protein [Enterococcus sp. BWM-S5]|uniref:Sugar ABC transporter substrate-binding protein n=1 Tax=Enterococcus larvae TaxID=2794352 RepID=A0ABS4CNW3_9ENTE|nr:sugar ABC transporter substrate-binding protein [Enterococcus larvae]MBP1048276.1 sugar ABC transporter substrate-binding protein [Enterococcus larvae]